MPPPIPSASETAAGVDWAAQSKNRAAAALQRLPDGSLSLVALTRGITDPQAGRLCRDPELVAVGVDIPFGWPARFVDFLRGWNHHSAPEAPVPDYPAFCYRFTDHHIAEHIHKRPLSVSTDRIGVASRAWLQVVQDHSLAPQIDRGYGDCGLRNADCGLGDSDCGLPALIEVYPGGTLAALFNCRPEVTHEKYRKDLAVRAGLLDDLMREFRLWVSDDQREKLLDPRRWDEFDALVAALTAAIYAGMVAGREVVRPPDELRETIEREGWIFYPCRRGLATEAQRTPRGTGSGRGQRRGRK